MDKCALVINTFGWSPVAEHNMMCSVCWKNSAVLQMSTGVFLPCWKCQEAGWVTQKITGWRRFLIGRNRPSSRRTTESLWSDSDEM